MHKPLDIHPIHRRILRFFQEHPHAVESVRGISAWLGDEQEQISRALEELVVRKWLAAHETAAVRGFALTRDERVLAQIRQLLVEPP